MSFELGDLKKNQLGASFQCNFHQLSTDPWPPTKAMALEPEESTAESEDLRVDIAVLLESLIMGSFQVLHRLGFLCFCIRNLGRKDEPTPTQMILVITSDQRVDVAKWCHFTCQYLAACLWSDSLTQLWGG